MNERIKELWSQAGGHHSSGNQHSWPQYTIDNPEKFAELIVQECIDQVLTGPNGPAYYAVEVAMEMKEHFGVQ
jgi:hypothetical protein